MHISFFLRKKYPGYFSIEQIFTALAAELPSHLPQGSSCEMKEVPYALSAVNFFKNIAYVRATQTNVNHITGDIHYAILGCSRHNLNILTIHDCVLLERYKKWDPRYWIFRLWWYELPIHKADLVTVISDKTALDLRNKVWLGKNKIKVVNNFVNNSFTYSPKAFNKSIPQLLFIGSTENKNLDRVLKAITGLSCRLRIVGKLSAEQQLYIEQHQLAVDVSFALTLEELVVKYQEADIVLFPSLYEGFGMLVIEANAVGRPVVTSKISPLIEIAGDAAVFVDPYNVDSIRQGIIKVIEDDAFRETLVNNGLKNAAKYKLRTIADEYLQLYTSGLSDPRKNKNIRERVEA